ncbi:MAG: glucose 1-dehydrogenase [Rhodospirillales bacterium]|nr:glucose 1-dehydrogenase [Rhodospirillales bacterium]
MRGLKGKRAVVTGGGSGIGREICKRFGAEGTDVQVFDINASGAAETARMINEAGGTATAHTVDITNRASVDAAIAEVEKAGPIDILVNNAGVGAGKNIEELTLEDWRWVMSVNLDGVFLGTKYAIESMKTSGGGSIINMSSIEGMVGDRRLPAYDASKGGVRILTKSAALHCAKAGYNIRVNSLHPGFIDTPMVAGFVKAQGDASAAREELVRLHPIGHLGEPDDVAYAVVYLASDESKFVTGSEMVVDGGFTAQ